MACEKCGEEEWRLFGCGFHGFAGQATVRRQDGTFGYEHGARIEPWSRTCPRYCWSLPWVQAIRSDLRDYKRGALGCVLDLEVPHLEALRIAEAEEERWESEQLKTDE
jgi:hypothetical protein